MRAKLIRWALTLAPVVTLVAIVLMVTSSTRATRRAIRLVLGFSLLDWLDSIVDGASGLLSNVLRPITGFVRRVLRGTVNWLLDRLDGVVSFVWWILDAAKDFAIDIVNDVWTFFNVVWQQIQMARDWVWENAQRLFDNLANAVDYLARQVWDKLTDLTGWVNRQIESVMSWVGRNVLDPFLNFIKGIYDWVRRNIWDPLYAAIQESLAVIDNVWDWAYDKVTTALKWIYDKGQFLWDVIDSCLDWLIFLGRWGFDAIKEILNPGNFLSADWWAETAQRTVLEAGDAIEDTLIKWLD